MEEDDPQLAKENWEYALGKDAITRTKALGKNMADYRKSASLPPVVSDHINLFV